eukprot:403343057
MSYEERDIKQLVSQLESHIYQIELALKRQLKVSTESADAELDDLFLQKTFDIKTLVTNIPILRTFSCKDTISQKSTTQGNQDQEQIENQLLDQASKRLKLYLEALNEHIIKIVESESDEFLSVASKLENFKDVLGDLKDSVKEYYQIFKTEKGDAIETFSFLQQQYSELESVVNERDQLERLIMILEKYENIQSGIKKIKNGKSEEMYLDLEETVRDFQELWVNQNFDSQVKHQLAMIQKDLMTILNYGLIDLIKNSLMFKSGKQQDDSLYFDECQLSSYLRCYKIMDQKQIFYNVITDNLLSNEITVLVKKAFDQKTNQIMIQEIIEGILEHIIRITLMEQESFNFVVSYDVLGDCLWPLIMKSLDNQLSFVFSTANTQLFQKNFLIAQGFKNYLESKLGNQRIGQDLISKFNLQTYHNVLVIENIDKFTQELEKQFDQTNDTLRPIHQITIAYAIKVLKDDFYLQEIGDKLIKLSVQFVIRHLNFVMDKVNEKKSMATERILYILEDLTLLQKCINKNLAPLILLRLSVVHGLQATEEQMRQVFINPILKELKVRFDHLAEPCISGISTKIYQRLVENLQAFKQVATMFRMTNRDVENKPSQFLQNLLNPLQNLSEQKLFSTLSQEVKYQLFDKVLKGGLKELHNLINGIVEEEKKMHESLKKYKKEASSNSSNDLKQISDFEKMQVQLYIDIQELYSQIQRLYEDNFSERQEIKDLLQQLQLSFPDGESLYKKLFN